MRERRPSGEVVVPAGAHLGDRDGLHGSRALEVALGDAAGRPVVLWEARAAPLDLPQGGELAHRGAPCDEGRVVLVQQLLGVLRLRHDRLDGRLRALELQVLLLRQVHLEVLVPLDQPLGVHLPVPDLLAAVPLDALQERREGLGLLLAEALLLAPGTLAHLRRLPRQLPLLELIGVLLDLEGLLVLAHLGQRLLLPAQLEQLPGGLGLGDLGPHLILEGGELRHVLLLQPL
mmetsp:Transcript_68639/g.185440  ORF Transcript_68639/g.185440 Transcript_68639/m.185440 type:complete len:232 (+) Transcript_68639:203-898(+)